MDKPSRKRQRSASIGEMGATASSFLAALDVGPIVRDKIYYRENGDCVILVGRVLFKIHRFLLERDASAFSNMFSLPQEKDNNQTSTDENPLILYDDVNNFRALCWILYALPTVYSQQQKLSTANIGNLVSLYLISQKYHFEAHETFAQDLLYKHCLILEGKPAIKSNYFATCSESQLEALLRIAILTQRTPKSDSFPSTLQNIWINRLDLRKESIRFALEVGEALGLRNFVAALYYLELTRMRPVLAEGSIAYIHPASDLAPHQKLALYKGSWSLRHYWSKTREISPQKDIECSELDYCRHHCQDVWEGAWESYCFTEWKSRTFDPVRELSIVQSMLRIRSENEDCESPENTIDDMIAELKKSFADHFLGPLPATIPAAELFL